MKINLYELLSVVGAINNYSIVYEEKTISFLGEELKLTIDSPFDMVCKHVDKNEIMIHCSFEINVVSSCARCLENVSKTYLVCIDRTIDMEQKIAYSDNREECESISYIEDCTLDVDMLILDELYTILPMNVLCKEDCKGICKVCGINLNKSTCNCDQVVPDPRMAVFNDIFNQFKEV